MRSSVAHDVTSDMDETDETDEARQKRRRKSIVSSLDFHVMHRYVWIINRLTLSVRPEAALFVN
jgi:hypothetical protein